MASRDGASFAAMASFSALRSDVFSSSRVSSSTASSLARSFETLSDRFRRAFSSFFCRASSSRAAAAAASALACVASTTVASSSSSSSSAWTSARWRARSSISSCILRASASIAFLFPPSFFAALKSNLACAENAETSAECAAASSAAMPAQQRS
ncbi:hypothetical protein M885DRAFT_532334 [Pelagophyceae sp. CCMP2097]|nr:hypothetical protein M885DRAFT_532334 [Pelagophyceae sp. CCMP2097]